MTKPCELCGRYTKRGTNEHHLVPRTCHKNKWFKKKFTRTQMLVTVDLCHDCHGSIHKLIPREKELGRHYYTLELLAAHPQMQGFLSWVKRQK